MANESAGKIPDAGEWSTDFAIHYGLTDKERAGVNGMMVKFQRETLLAAAEWARRKPKQFLTPDELERIAEEIGRQG